MTFPADVFTRLVLPLVWLVFGSGACAETRDGGGVDTGLVDTLVDTTSGTSNPTEVATPDDTAEPALDIRNGIAEVEVEGGMLVPAPIDEPFGEAVPRAMYAVDRPAGACAVGDHVIPMYGADTLDDCRICQCTWRGGMCARRASCARDV